MLVGIMHHPAAYVVLHATSKIKGHKPTMCCSGMQPHASLASSFHLTVFMTSQPGDPRPDPFTPRGGIDPSQPPVPIPAASSATLQKEIETFRQIALTGKPAFEVPCCEPSDACA